MKNKIKVSEATGTVLDYLVAKCEGYNPFVVDKNAAYYSPDHGSLVYALFSTNWSQGGPIIEREKIQLLPSITSETWNAACPHHGNCIQVTGPTPLIAAMRCYVVSKLGDEVEIPEELL